ncbi:MAG: hypothetical protein ABIK99_07130 [candidate division WOR-3 bacterium]
MLGGRREILSLSSFFLLSPFSFLPIPQKRRDLSSFLFSVADFSLLVRIKWGREGGMGDNLKNLVSFLIQPCILSDTT